MLIICKARAHVNYDQYSRITSVDYQNAIHLTISRDVLGRVSGRNYTQGTTTPVPLTNSAGLPLTDTVVRASTGDIISDTELGQTKSYSYDTAGRLTGATVAGNTFSYSYGAQASVCTGKPGVATDLSLAGKDSNRTSMTVNGVTTTYCYNQADQLVASSNLLYDAPTYDSHGNTLTLGVASGTAKQTTFTYDSLDRNSRIVQRDSANNTITISMSRDVQGRLLSRTFSTAPATNYAYTASGDSPDFLTDATGTVTEKYLTLPGGVLVTIRPPRTSAGSSSLSLPNIHGDIFATTNADGLVTGTFQTGPFGEQLPANPTKAINTTGGNPAANGVASPWATVAGGTFQYVGEHEKLTESTLQIQPVQMGARVYIPGLGRFLSVDPVPGGTPNSYVYAPDGVNDFDLDGTFISGPTARFDQQSSIIMAKLAQQCDANTTCSIAITAVSFMIPGTEWSGGIRATRMAQVQINAARGARAEKLVAFVYKLNPVNQVRTARTATRIVTNNNLVRYPDIVVRNRITGRVINIEVKAGRSVYTKAQRAKDAAIRLERNIKTRLVRLRWM